MRFNAASPRVASNQPRCAQIGSARLRQALEFHTQGRICGEGMQPPAEIPCYIAQGLRVCSQESPSIRCHSASASWLQVQRRSSARSPSATSPPESSRSVGAHKTELSCRRGGDLAEAPQGEPEEQPANQRYDEKLSPHHGETGAAIEDRLGKGNDRTSRISTLSASARASKALSRPKPPLWNLSGKSIATSALSVIGCIGVRSSGC